MEYKLNCAQLRQMAPRLHAGDRVLLSGRVYTSRDRNAAVCDAIVRNKAVYLCAIGGAGALASKCITTCKVIAYEDLGCESVKELEFADFPLTVAIACDGSNLFDR